MALIFRGCSHCSICNEIIGHDDSIVATTHFIADRSDPLWRFSDSGMHVACYESWRHRDEFAARYEAVMGIRPGWGRHAYTSRPSGPGRRESVWQTVAEEMS